MLFEDTIAIAFPARLDPNFGSDHRNDADDLRLRCEPVWIEGIGRPGKVVVHAVEAHAEQMLDPLRCTPSVPAGRLVCTRDGRQARDGLASRLGASAYRRSGRAMNCKEKGGPVTARPLTVMLVWL